MSLLAEMGIAKRLGLIVAIGAVALSISAAITLISQIGRASCRERVFSSV